MLPEHLAESEGRKQRFEREAKAISKLHHPHICTIHDVGFGLAKVVRDQLPGDASDAPTQQKELTDDQVVVGTLHYIAPEQLEAKTVDARSDVWAFGALLYEMITGTKAFVGDSQASVITAIMTGSPPPLSEKTPLSPPLLEHQVRRCLEKDPARRWQSIGDLKLELEWLVTAPEVAPPPPTRPDGAGSFRRSCPRR